VGKLTNNWGGKEMENGSIQVWPDVSSRDL